MADRQSIEARPVKPCQDCGLPDAYMIPRGGAFCSLLRITPQDFWSRVCHQTPTSQSRFTAASLCCAAADGDCAVSAARTKRMASAYTRSPALKMAGATDARSVASPFARSSAGHKKILFKLLLLFVVYAVDEFSLSQGRLWRPVDDVGTGRQPCAGRAGHKSAGPSQTDRLSRRR